MDKQNQWDNVRLAIEEDITKRGVKRGEFVVSAMTRAIANALQYFVRQGGSSELPALDIGTGTAYHSALLCASGLKRIISVDINKQAIMFAKERLAQYFSDIAQFNESDFEHYLKLSEAIPQSINLYNYALDELGKFPNIDYAVVSFNPPILYPLLSTEFDKPATHGVYFENKKVEEKAHDLVYKLYETVAQNNLKKGAHIVCVWANLNRHLVELAPFTDNTPAYVHPAEILENWFDFKFVNEPESFDDFYCHKTVLGAGFFNQSETGKLYTNNLRNGIENNYYSQLMVASEEENLSGTYFHFGVLHLEKVSDSANEFRLINGSSKGLVD